MKATFDSLDKNVQVAWKRWVKLNPLTLEDYDARKLRYDQFIENLIDSAGWAFEEIGRAHV